MTTPSPARRAVLFDAVGTLIYADPPVADIYHAIASKHGVQISLSEMKSRVRSAINVHLRERTTSSEAIERQRWQTIVAVVFHDSHDLADAIFADLWKHFASPAAWRVYDDVEACFAALQKREIEYAIASNFDARLKDVCQGHGVLRDVQVFCSSELGYAKPNVNFFRAVEQRLQLSPEQLTMVGDDIAADHQGATAAGWKSLHLVRGECNVVGQIATLRELISLLAHP